MTNVYRELEVDTPRVFVPFSKHARYKAAHGGRGSGKSHEFAADMILDGLSIPEFRGVCIRETQKSTKYSSKQLLCDKIEQFNVGYYFDVQEAEIKIHGSETGRIIFTGMQDHTAESIKSLEGFDRFWVTEAQMLSKLSLRNLRPTMRSTPRHVARNMEPEGWFDWNPRLPDDPVDEFFRGSFGAPADSIVVQANWSDNPFFPRDLASEREEDYRRMSPEEYAHVWQGAYYIDDANQLIAYQWLIDAKERGQRGWKEDGSRPTLIVSADVADGGVDRTVVTAKLVYQSFQVLLRQEKHHFSASVAPMRAADACIDMFERYKGGKTTDEMHVDANGVGSGTAGKLIDAGYRVVRYVGGAGSDNTTRFRNRRVQCHIAMRDTYRDNKIVIDKDAFDDQRDWTEFVNQMTMVRRRPGLEKVEDLETKEHLVARTGKSPDRAESHAISFSTQLPTIATASAAEQVVSTQGVSAMYDGGIAA